jgi:hypothetical protein
MLPQKFSPATMANAFRGVWALADEPAAEEAGFDLEHAAAPTAVAKATTPNPSSRRAGRPGPKAGRREVAAGFTTPDSNRNSSYSQVPNAEAAQPCVDEGWPTRPWCMAKVALVLAVLLLVWLISSLVRGRRGGIVARRGMGIGADLGALADKPRVRVRAMTKSGPDRVHVILTPESGPGDGLSTSSDLDLDVVLSDGEFGFELLQEWQRSESSLAIVMPPGSRLVRLRSIDDLQPLTLRRADEG